MIQNTQIKCSIEDMHQVQLEILKEFKRICDLNNIKYYLACGSCLGAIRDHGFIPWDHDADVFVYANDIKKLLNVREQFDERYFLQGKETDPEFNYSIYRLRDSYTTCIEKCDVNLDINHGFCIDIYPLYYAPTNRVSLQLNIIVSYIYRICIAGRVPLNHGKFLKLCSKIILTLYRGEKRQKKILSCYNHLMKYQNTDKVLTYFGLDVTPTSAILYEKSWFDVPSKILFEGVKFSGPTNPDAYLKMKYGKYMELPPIEDRTPKFDELEYADVQNGYKQFKGVYYKQ